MKEKVKYTIRTAKESDAEAVHDIYGAYVESNRVTFTVNNPSVEQYRQKILNTEKMYPFYVAEDEQGKIIGYCCGSPLRPHDAYRWNVESTIVLAPDTPRRQGIASALYNQFMDTLQKQNFQYVYGVVVDTNTESIELHKALGFAEVGHFKNAGYKNGKWLGIVWMQKYIGRSEKMVKEPIPFTQMNNNSKGK